MGSAFWRQSEQDKKKGKKDKDNFEDRPLGPNGLPAGLEHELPRLKYPVAKHWLEQGGRTILCEGVRFAAVSDMLAELPQPKKERADLPARFPAQGRIAASARSGGRQIPQLHPASALDEQIAKIQYAKPETLLAMASPGFVMDYQTLNTVPAYTFEAGRTYLIQSDMVIRGTTLIEGGTIIKYARSTDARTVQLRCLGSVVCDTDPYRPAIFTAKDDHQYGVSFWSNSPVSGYYALRAIWIEPSGEPVTIEHIRIKYATNGIFFDNSPGAKLRHSQFIGCRHPVATQHQDLEVENVLIDDFGVYAFWAMHSWPAETILPGQEVNIHASHVTVSNGPWLAWNSHWDGHMGTTEFKNSLLVNVNGGYVDGSFYPGDIGDIFVQSPFLQNVPHTSVFATQNLGRFYLPAGSPYRDAGHAPVDPLLALDLRQRTTSAPNLVQGYVSGPMGPFVALDDDGSLDLGYHYARIDHAIHYAIANANVTVGPGTVVSCSGALGMQVGASHWHSWWSPRKRITLQGEPGNHVLCVDDDTVQEQSPPPNVYRSTMMRFNERYTTNELRASFTDVYGIGRHSPIEVPYGIERFADVEFRDSTFQGVNFWIRLYTSSDRFRAVNVLFKECFGVGFDGDAGIVRLSNCLFYRSPVSLYGNNASLYHWSIENSVFDQSRLYGDGLWNMGPSQFQKNAFVGYLPWGDWPYWQMRPTLTLATPYAWQSGPLGEFYQPSSNNPLLNAGSRNANLGWGDFRLAHHTVRDDLQPEGNTRIDLGYHYIATDTNGNALDDNLDGIPNYVQDTNGNGVVDNGEVAWTTSPLDPDGDEDGDGLTNYEETQLFAQYDLDPNNPDSDGDGISDAQEDFDGDGLSNGFELRRYQSSPTNARSLDPAGVALDSQIIFSRSSAPLDPSSAAALASVLAANVPPSQAPPQQSPVVGLTDERPVSFAQPVSQQNNPSPGFFTVFEGFEDSGETRLLKFSIQGAPAGMHFDLYSRGDLGPGGYWNLRFRSATAGETFKISTSTLTPFEFFVAFQSIDSDHDSLLDGFELLTAGCVLGSDPLEGERDQDGDGLSNLYEQFLTTALGSSGSDNDGASDLEEIQGGGHPLMAHIQPLDVASGEFVEIPKATMSVTASSSVFGHSAREAIDGLLEPFSNYWKSDPEKGRWLRIDLGDRFPVNRIVFHVGMLRDTWQRSGSPEGIAGLSFYLTDSDSLDPASWGQPIIDQPLLGSLGWVGNIDLSPGGEVKVGRYLILYDRERDERRQVSTIAELSIFAPSRPVISKIPDVNAEVGRVIGPIDFEVGHSNYDPTLLNPTLVSDNGGLIPNNGIHVVGSGARRLLILKPNPGQAGVANLTVNLSHDGQQTQRPFKVNVQSPSDSDSDWLTRYEEEILMETNPYLADSDWDGVNDASDPDGARFAVRVQILNGANKPLELSLDGHPGTVSEHVLSPIANGFATAFINPNEPVTFTLNSTSPIVASDDIGLILKSRGGHNNPLGGVNHLPWLPGPVEYVNGSLIYKFWPFRVDFDFEAGALKLSQKGRTHLPTRSVAQEFSVRGTVVIASDLGPPVRTPLESGSQLRWRLSQIDDFGTLHNVDFGTAPFASDQARFQTLAAPTVGERYQLSATLDATQFTHSIAGGTYTAQSQAQAFTHRTGDLEIVPLLDINSMDKFLATSIAQSSVESLGGEANVGISIKNLTSGQTFSYSSLADAFIYDQPFAMNENEEEDFFNQEEIEMELSGEDLQGRLGQEVLFFRDRGRLHVRTIFDRAGSIEITLHRGHGSQRTVVERYTHTLVEDPEIGSLIDTIDAVLSDEWTGVSAAVRRVAFKERGLTSKIANSIWDRLKQHFRAGVRVTTQAASVVIERVALGSKGFVEGAWMGIKDDALSIPEIIEMALHPIQTGRMLYEGLKVLGGMELSEWGNIGRTMVESFLTTGREGVGEWTTPTDSALASYLAGFTSGYIAEQVAVTYLTAGVLRMVNFGARMSQVLRAAARGVAPVLEAATELRTRAQKIKNSIFRRFSQDATSPEVVKALKRMVDELYGACTL